MRVLAYGTTTYLHSKYLRMNTQVIRKFFIKFVEGVISSFSDVYLRKSTEEDMKRLLHIGEQECPCMFGNIDCMHCELKNYPTSWVGQYAGRGRKLTIILEAVASKICGSNMFFWNYRYIRDHIII